MSTVCAGKNKSLNFKASLRLFRKLGYSVYSSLYDLIMTTSSQIKFVYFYSIVPNITNMKINIKILPYQYFLEQFSYIFRQLVIKLSQVHATLYFSHINIVHINLKFSATSQSYPKKKSNHVRHL